MGLERFTKTGQMDADLETDYERQKKRRRYLTEEFDDPENRAKIREKLKKLKEEIAQKRGNQE